MPRHGLPVSVGRGRGRGPAKKGERNERGTTSTTTSTRRSTRIQEQEEEEPMDTDDILDDSEVEDDEDEQEDEEEDESYSGNAHGVGSPRKRSSGPRAVGRFKIPGSGSGDRGKQTKKALKAKKAQFAKENQVIYKMEEMVQNTLLYMLLMQHRKVPVKRADIMKHCVNSQSTDLPEVLKVLDQRLNDVFGMKICGLEESNKHGLYQHYILLSNFNLSVSDVVTPRDQESDCKRALLFLVLTIIYMTNGPIEEDDIWKIVDEMKFTEFICRKEQLHRYLKTEFVLTMYLQQQELKDTENPVYRYSWGLRAEKEFSRYQILKFVSKQFPGRKPDDYIIQYQKARETEAEAIDADRDKEQVEAENAENVEGEEETLEEIDELLPDASDAEFRGLTHPSPDSPPPDTPGTINETDILDLDDGGEEELAEGIETMQIRSGPAGEKQGDEVEPVYPEFLHFPIGEDYDCPPTPGTSMGCLGPRTRSRSHIPYPTIYDDSDED